MRIAVVLLTSGLLLVGSEASADNCPAVAEVRPVRTSLVTVVGGGYGNAYGNCNYASSLWAGYCSEPTVGGCGGGKMGGLFGKRRGGCGVDCGWLLPMQFVVVRLRWRSLRVGPQEGGCGGGCETAAELDCGGCGGSTGWMDGLRHRFARRGWQQGLMVGDDCGGGYPYGMGCASGIGQGGYATGMVGAGGAVPTSQPQPAAEVDSWQGSTFDYSNRVHGFADDGIRSVLRVAPSPAPRVPTRWREW